MARNVLIAVAAIAVLSGAAYFLLSESPAPTTELSSRDDAPEPAKRLDGYAAGVDRVAPIGSVPFAEREESGGAFATTSIRVVDESKAPVGGVVVGLHRRDRRTGGDPRRAFDMRGADADAPPWRTSTTDADGRAILHDLPARGVRCVARLGDRLGVVDIDQEDVVEGGEHVLVLKPLKRVDVLVVDPNGAPAPFVEISASTADNTPAFQRRTQWTSTPDGKASIEISAAQPDLYATENPKIAATLPGSPRVEDVATFVDGVANVVLRTPPSVRVKIAVEAGEGETIPEKATVEWNVEATDDASDARTFFSTSPFGSKDVVAGVAHVAGFKPGATVRFHLRAEGRAETSTTVELPKASGEHVVPVKLGERLASIVARVVDDVGAPVEGFELRYEILRTDPSAPPKAAAEETSRDDGRSARRRSPASFRSTPDPVLSTDSDGFVRVPVPVGAAGSIAFRERRGRAPRGPRGGPNAATEATPPLATRAFETKAATTEVRVDDLVVPRKPIFAAGIVVDAADKPVAGASVRISLDGFDQIFETADVSFDSGSGRRFDLGAVLSVEARSNEHGRFELRVDAPETGSEALALIARTRRGSSKPTAFVAGATDVRIVVDGFGAIVGSARLVSEAFDRNELTVFAEPANAGAADRTRPRIRSSGPMTVGPIGRSGGGRGGARRVDAETGAFRLDRLAPGRFDVVFLYEGAEAVRVRDVEVVSEKTSEDPRLNDVLIGGDFMTATVVVLDDAGAPVQGASVRFTSAREDGELDFGMWFARGARETTDADGRLARIFPRPRPIDEVLVSAKDFTTTTVAKPSFPLVVRLSRGATLVVAFDVAGGLQTPSEGGRWRVRARPRPADGESSAAAREADLRRAVEGARANGPGRGPGRGASNGGPGTTAIVDATTGEASIRALRPGTYDLTMWYEGPAITENSPFATIVGGGGRAIKLGEAVVGDSNGVLRVRFSVDAESVRDSIANRSR